MKLNRLCGHFHSHFCRVQFRLSRLYGIYFLGCLRHSSLVNEELRCLNLGSHVSKLELRILECADRSAELLSLLHISDGVVESALSQTERLGSDTDTAAVQCVHCDVEALTLLPKEILLRDAAVGKDQLVSGRTADTHLLLLRTEGETGRSFLHDECGNLFLQAAALLNRSCDCKNDINVSFLTVGDEALGAVKHPLFTVKHSLGLLTLRVGTCTGLCQAECAQLLTLCKGN